MTVEEKKVVRFAKEKTSSYQPAEGSWESLLMLVKDRFAFETCGVGDMEFWQPKEEKATMTPEEGCFQYYLAGVGHRSLAEWIVDRLNPGASDRKQRVNEVAEILYDAYPRKYREEIKK